MSPKVVIIFLGALAIGGATYYQATNAPKSRGAAVPTHSGPPANAEFVDPEFVPGAIIRAVGGKKGVPKSVFVGKWNSPDGWEGAVEAVVTWDGQDAVRIVEYDPTIIGGSYMIIALLGEDHGIEKGKVVRVQGRISDVVAKAVPLGVINQIILADARVVKKK